MQAMCGLAQRLPDIPDTVTPIEGWKDSMTQAVTLETYNDAHFEGVKALWDENAPPDSPPWNIASKTIPSKLAVQPDLLIIAVEGGKVVGSIMPGYDGHRGWLYAMAVLSSHRRRNIGTLLVREAEKRLTALGCTKINLQIRASNAGVTAFYEGLGYKVEERISMGKRL
jgi:ribosomal protein S18 acetylase RimI-like enzyme